MLFSHRHKFLFVHIAKTGGTSVRSALSGLLWSDPLRWPEWLFHRVSHLTGHRLGCKIPRHAPAIVASEMLPHDVFQQLLKFAFVRNPWDRTVSVFSHFQRERQDILRAHKLSSFEDFVQWLCTVDLSKTKRATLIRAMQRPQIEYLTDMHGQLLVDFIGRYECLADHFGYVLARIDRFGARLPHKRQSDRPDDYRAFYSDQTAELIGRCYVRDVDAFGYQFDPTDEQLESMSELQAA